MYRAFLFRLQRYAKKMNVAKKINKNLHMSFFCCIFAADFVKVLFETSKHAK